MLVGRSYSRLKLTKSECEYVCLWSTAEKHSTAPASAAFTVDAAASAASDDEDHHCWRECSKLPDSACSWVRVWVPSNLVVVGWFALSVCVCVKTVKLNRHWSKRELNERVFLHLPQALKDQWWRDWASATAAADVFVCCSKERRVSVAVAVVVATVKWCSSWYK